MPVNIGPRIGIDGEREYRASIQQIIQQQKTLKAEMQQTASAFDKTTTAQEKVRAKAKSLTDQIKVQKEHVEKLAEGVRKSTDKYGEADTQTLKWKESLAQATAELNRMEAELRELPSNVELLGQKFEAAGSKIKSIGDKVSGIGDKMTTMVTLPIVGAGTVMVKKFAEVDKTMQLTNATMGNTAEEANLLNKAMSDAASKSIFGMNDAATATLNFARAGLTAEQAAAALAPAMNLAAGEGGNLDTVSGGLVATINGFGDTFDNAAHYADVFAAACNNSALDVDSLAGAMSVAAPIFKAAGYSIDDAALYMGVMANNGIDASTAANSLKTGIARLASPAKEGAAMIEQLGIEIFNADGSMKDSLTVQKLLHDSFSTLSEQEQIAAASAIFGKNQMSNWLALINTAPEDVNSLSDSLANAAGTTDEMAEAMMGGFGGSVEQLKSSLDVLMTSLGKLAAEYLTPVVTAAQGLIDKFNGLDDTQKKHIITIAGVVAAVGPVLSIGGRVISTVGTLTSGVGKAIEISGKVGPLLSGTIIPAVGGVITTIGPFLPIIAAVAAGIAGVILVIKNWGAISDWIKDKWQKLKDKVSEIVGGIKKAFDFKWEFPKIKMPHFSIRGKFSLSPPSVPHLAVDWYKKAYSNAVMFNKPTVLATSDGLKGFGDGNGGEIVVGRNLLIETIRDAMRGGDTFGDMIINIYGAEGQDVNELAELVSEKINDSVERRKVVLE